MDNLKKELLDGASDGKRPGSHCNGRESDGSMGDHGEPDDALSEEPPAKRPKLSDGDDQATVEDALPGPSDTDSVGVAEACYDSPFTRNDVTEKMGSMHEFEIIDEVAADDDDPDDDGDVEHDSDESLDDVELYALLEEGITKDSIAHSERPIEREKVVLVERGHDPFDILPEGWLVVTHNSGMPVYLHRQSRVCTLAQPYFLGSGSARKHDIPISAVPCLKYRTALQKERPEPEEAPKQPAVAGNSQTASPPGAPQDTADSTEDATMKAEQREDAASEPKQTDETEGSQSVENGGVLTEQTTEDTCSKAVENGSGTDEATAEGAISKTEQMETEDGDGKDEQTVTEGGSSKPEQQAAEETGSKSDLTNPFPSVKIKSADEMRRETSLDFLKLREYCQNLFEFKTVTVQRYRTWRDRRKHMGSKKPSRPELPPNTKLITCSVPTMSPDKKKTKGKEFFLNPSGKSYVCILHEYVQHTMKVQPFYVFKELENSKTPYSATVMINDIEYGTGCAISKKLAKSEAAKNTLKILIPEMNALTDDQLQKNSEDLSFFDEIKIEDPRISELGNKAGQPSPYQILRECLSRNYGMGDTDCLLDMKPLKHQNCEFTITVGKHKATVVAKSKRSGKQRAAQAILQKLHPHVPSWGSLLRLYGNTADRVQCAKRTEVNEVKRHRPNQAILDRLRDEMRKLSAQRDAIKSHGRLVVNSEDLPNKVNSVDL